MTKPSRILEGQGIGANAQTGKVLKAGIRRPELSDNSSQGAIHQKEILASAVQAVSRRLSALGKSTLGESAEVFEALDEILTDVDLARAAELQIESGLDAGSAFSVSLNQFISALDGFAPFRDRIAELRELEIQVFAEIAGVSASIEVPEDGQYVLVTTDISALQVMQLPKSVVAIVTTLGGTTSHAAIICRARGIPMLVGCSDADSLAEGEIVLVDPEGHRVVIGAGYESATSSVSFSKKFEHPVIKVQANLGSLIDAELAFANQSDGVGLVRTELLFLDQLAVPSLSDQAEAYIKLFNASPPGPIVARTFDNARDKALRFTLGADLDELVKGQLQALEKARLATGRELWVMAPMISSVTQAMKFVEAAKSEGKFTVGIMVERASIIPAIPLLSEHLDFVSVGTNDLLEDMIGASRAVAPVPGFSHWQPALIAALADIASQSAAAGIHSGVCGESASDPSFAIVLAGLGFDSVSASPSQVAQVRTALSSVDKDQAQTVAKAALKGLSAEEAKSLALAKLAQFQG